MTDGPPTPKPPPHDKQGGDLDIATDVSPPAAAPAEPGYHGGKTGDRDSGERRADREGGMIGEG